MKKTTGHSYTSNMAKLLKHIDNLKDIQNGKIRPIMAHIVPTHRCNLSCVHCCFRNREDHNADMPFEMFKEAISQLAQLGVKAIELTGGGDPTLYPNINVAIDYAKSRNMHIGLITNGLALDKIRDLDRLDWIRISLNTLDYKTAIPDIDRAKKRSKVSFCYIWNENTSIDQFKKVAAFCLKHEVVCRFAPDCIKTPGEIRRQLIEMHNIIEIYGNDYTFLSDFNVNAGERPRGEPARDCFIHMIKPCIYLDGYVYACPSAELALENKAQMNAEFRVCEIKNIEKFYNSPKAAEMRKHKCSYCKYVQQNEFMKELTRRTDFNEFA